MLFPSTLLTGKPQAAALKDSHLIIPVCRDSRMLGRQAAAVHPSNIHPCPSVPPLLPFLQVYKGDDKPEYKPEYKDKKV
jgi:hypothetical protein